MTRRSSRSPVGSTPTAPSARCDDRNATCEIDTLLRHRHGGHSRAERGGSHGGRPRPAPGPGAGRGGGLHRVEIDELDLADLGSVVAPAEAPTASGPSPCTRSACIRNCSGTCPPTRCTSWVGTTRATWRRCSRQPRSATQFDGRGSVYIERRDIAEVADPDSEEGRQRGVNPVGHRPGRGRAVVGVVGRAHGRRHLRLKVPSSAATRSCRSCGSRRGDGANSGSG